MPGDRRVRVRGVQVHGRRREQAETGQRTAVNLGGIEVGRHSTRAGTRHAGRADHHAPRRRDRRLAALGQTAQAWRARALSPGNNGGARSGRRWRMPDRPTSDPANVRPSASGSKTQAALVRGDRFILRAYSPTVTIGGGQVLDPEPPRAGLRTKASEGRFAALSMNGHPDRDLTALTRMIADAGLTGLPTASLVSRAGVAPAHLADVVAALEQGTHARVAADRSGLAGRRRHACGRAGGRGHRVSQVAAARRRDSSRGSA